MGLKTLTRSTITLYNKLVIILILIRNGSVPIHLIIVIHIICVATQCVNNTLKNKNFTINCLYPGVKTFEVCLSFGDAVFLLNMT